MKKKLLISVLCLALSLCVLASCNKKDDEIVNNFGKAANEILTYDKVDYSKTQIIVSKTGNITVGSLNDAFMKKYPDIQIIPLDITGGTSGYVPAQEYIMKGFVPDIMVTSGNFLNDSFLETYCTDLSSNPVTGRFKTESLSSIAVNQKTYTLPGLSKYVAIAYNKTLFENNHWKVPKSRAEFFALCETIESTTDISAFNPNLKYDGELTILAEGMCFGDVFAGIENQQWLNDFCDGKEGTTFASHMQPLYDVLDDLIDAGYAEEKYFKYSATTRGEEFAAGKIAMINSSVTSFTGNYKFGFFPFPPADASDTGWVHESLDSEIAVPKKTRTAAQQDAVNKYLDFYASAEGQTAYTGKSALSSNLKSEYYTPTPSELTEGLNTALEAGNAFSTVQYVSDEGYLSVFYYGELKKMVADPTYTAAKSMKYVDDNCRNFGAPSTVPPVIATASEDFTILEVSNMFADMFREKTGADVALIQNNVAYRGNLMRLYKGDIDATKVTVLMPRSYGNSTLIKANMTGKQLLAALDKPWDGSKAVANCTYAFSGLKCTVAPWNPVGSKMLSVTLADGTPIDEDKIYSVAFWDGTVWNGTAWDDTVWEDNVPESFYDKTSVTTYTGDFSALLTAYLTEKKTVAPAKDGRIILNWD